MLPRSPTKPLLAVDENAREYPNKSHWAMTTALEQDTTQINDMADFRLARPAYKNAKLRHTMSSAESNNANI